MRIFSAIFNHNFHISTVEYRTGREKVKYCPIFLLSKNVSHFSEARARAISVEVLLSVSKITYLPLSTGHNNKGNPLIGVEHSFIIFIIPKGTKQVRYY